MRKSLTAAALAASLTAGGIAGATLFVPDLVSAQDTDSTDSDKTDFFEDALTPLVENGTITQEQADAVVEAIGEAMPERGFGHHMDHGPGPRIFGGVDLAEVLGISQDELRDAFSAGQTIAEIAEANGIDVNDVIDALVEANEQRLAEAIEEGRLTQEQADERSQEATERITDLVNGELEFGPHMDRHRGPNLDPDGRPSFDHDFDDDGSGDDDDDDGEGTGFVTSSPDETTTA